MYRCLEFSPARTGVDRTAWWVTARSPTVPRAIRTQRATGVMTTACRYMEIQRNTGNPIGEGRLPLNQTPARDRLGRLG